MPQQILIIGAGFAGVWSALSARRLISAHVKDKSIASDIEVTVVAPEPTLNLRPRLYEADPATKAASVAGLFRTTGVRFVRATVDTIHPLEHEVEVHLASGERSTLPYDRLVVASGSQLVYPNIPGLREHTFNVDQMDGATRLEAHLQSLASRPRSEARNTVVICGAGFTGVEVAADMPQRLRNIVGPDTDIRVVLVARESSIASTLGAGPRPHIQRALKSLGVETTSSTTISAVDANGITTSTGARIETLTTIWTAGVVASPLIDHLKTDKDASGRVLVDHDLRLPCSSTSSTYSDIFIAGDTASAATDPSATHRTMMSCQHAVPLGKAAGNNAAADLLGLPTRAYLQPTYVTCLDLGPWGSVLTVGWSRRVVFAGPTLAKMVKQYINGTLIVPPGPEDAQAALDAADPATSSDLAQRALGLVFHIIASLRIF